MENEFDIFGLDNLFFEEVVDEHRTAADQILQAENAVRDANALFELWWREPPVRVVGERLSTLAMVQVAAFLKYGEWAWRRRGEWSFIASYRGRATAKDDLELLNFVKTDEHRLTFGKCSAAEGLRLLRSAGEPLQFRHAAPFPLIRQACQAYLLDMDSKTGLREISIQLETSNANSTLAVDVCADIYRACSRALTAPGTGQRALYPYAHGQAKACLSRVRISPDAPKCRRCEANAIKRSNAVPAFFEYGADVLAHLGRDDVDKLQLMSRRWSRLLERMRASLPIRPLCVDLYVAKCASSIEICVYNPLVYKAGDGTDRRLLKCPHQSPDIDSAVVAGHLRNSHILCFIVGHVYREPKEEHECVGAQWMSAMLSGIDNCKIGKLRLDLSDTLPDVDAFANVVAHRRPRKLDFLIWSEEQHDRLFAAQHFWTANALGTTELVSVHVQPEWKSAVVPAWKNYWLSSPLRRMTIYYSSLPGTAAVGFRYAIDDIIEDFLGRSDRQNPPSPSELRVSVAQRVPLIREERTCARHDVQAPTSDRQWMRAERCDEYVFRNACIQKELTVYVCDSEHHSAAVCRIE